MDSVTRSQKMEAVVNRVQEQSSRSSEQAAKQAVSGTDTMRGYSQARSYIMPSVALVAAVGYSQYQKGLLDRNDKMHMDFSGNINSAYKESGINARKTMPESFKEGRDITGESGTIKDITNLHVTYNMQDTNATLSNGTTLYGDLKARKDAGVLDMRNMSGQSRQIVMMQRVELEQMREATATAASKNQLLDKIQHKMAMPKETFNSVRAARSGFTKNYSKNYSMDEMIHIYQGYILKSSDHAGMKTRRYNRKSVRSVKNALFREMHQAEAMQGYEMLEAAEMPVKATGKLCFTAVDKTVWHAEKFIRMKRIPFEKGTLGYDTQLKYVQSAMGSRHHTGYLFKRAESAMTQGIAKSANEWALKQLANSGNSLIMQAVANQTATVSGMVLENGGSVTAEMAKAAKTSTKTAVKAYIRQNTKVGKFVSKVTTKTAEKLSNTLVGRLVTKVTTFIGGKFLAARQMISSALSFIGSAIGGFVSTYILPVVGMLLIILILIHLFLQLLASVVGLSSPSTPDGEGVVYSQPDVSAIVDILEDLHDDKEREIQAVLDSYTVRDIVYPNGSYENYKELICALSVYTSNDIMNYSETEIRAYLEDLYDQTHIISVDEYPCSITNSAAGTTTEYTGAHVYVNILRGDALCYSVLSSDGVVVGNPCPSGSYVNGEWLSIVECVKKAIAATGTEYSQTKTISANLNGNTVSIRPDCSGFVSACLNLYGSMNTTWSSYNFKNEGSLQGFTKYAWSGWDNLQTGDIIAYRTGDTGHVEIFAYNCGGTHFVYNCGSTYSVRQSGVTPSGTASFQVVWRPNSAGSGAAASDNENILASNTGSVEYDAYGNQTGGVQAVLNTINALKNDSNFVLDYEKGIHTLTDKGGKSSSADFVRYVYSKHGVTVGVNAQAMLDGLQKVQLEGVKAGDIIICSGDGSAEDYIPLIYTGGGNAVGYVHRGALGAYSTGIHDFVLGTIDEESIAGIVRPTGILTQNVYGSSGCFGGWTDDAILLYQNYLNQDMWIPDDGTHFGDDSYDGYLGYHEENYLDSTVISVETTPAWKSTFIDMIGTSAVYAYEDYRILPSFVVAEAILKSGWGNSEQASRYHNYFDMKHDWDGSEYTSINYYTHDAAGNYTAHRSLWKIYDNSDEGVRAFMKRMSTSFPSMKDVRVAGDEAYAAAAKNYISSDYAARLIDVITTYNLTRFDEKALRIRDARQFVADSTTKLNSLSSTYSSSMNYNSGIPALSSAITSGKLAASELSGVISDYGLSKYQSEVDTLNKAITRAQNVKNTLEAKKAEDERRAAEEAAAKAAEEAAKAAEEAAKNAGTKKP